MLCPSGRIGHPRYSFTRRVARPLSLRFRQRVPPAFRFLKDRVAPGAVGAYGAVFRPEPGVVLSGAVGGPVVLPDISPAESVWPTPERCTSRHGPRHFKDHSLVARVPKSLELSSVLRRCARAGVAASRFLLRRDRDGCGSRGCVCIVVSCPKGQGAVRLRGRVPRDGYSVKHNRTHVWTHGRRILFLVIYWREARRRQGAKNPFRLPAWLFRCRICFLIHCIYDV